MPLPTHDFQGYLSFKTSSRAGVSTTVGVVSTVSTGAVYPFAIAHQFVGAYYLVDFLFGIYQLLNGNQSLFGTVYSLLQLFVCIETYSQPFQLRQTCINIAIHCCAICSSKECSQFAQFHSVAHRKE